MLYKIILDNIMLTPLTPHNKKLLFKLLIITLVSNFLFSIYSMLKVKKVVVFDLDETLGHFVELGMFWDALNDYYKKNLPSSDFFQVLDIFPEFVRPHILTMLKYLVNKKSKKICDKVIIYTNNQGPRSWAKMISDYFNWKLKYKLFDEIIAAFKVNGKQVEMCRTSHGKKHSDFLRCTNLPASTKVCFLDDQYHPHMDHERVYYINFKPYIFEISFHEMALRYYEQTKMDVDKNVFINHIVTFMKRYNFTPRIKSQEEQHIDKIVSKKTFGYLKSFFDNKPRKTRRLPKPKHRRSYKH